MLALVRMHSAARAWLCALLLSPTSLLGIARAADPDPAAGQISLVPGVFLTLDAAEPAGTDPLASGRPGIQVDASSNVLALNDRVSKAAVVHGYGEVSLVPGGPGGRPYFHGATSSYNQAWDSMTLPPELAERLVGPPGAAWSAIFVMRRTQPGPANLIKIHSASTHVDVLGARGAADGALRIEQNNGPANGYEPSTELTSLGRWQVVSFLCDGSTLSIYRNGVRTLQTRPAPLGGLSGITEFKLLNNPQSDVSYLEIAAGAPSLAQHTAEIRRLASLYGIAGVAQVTAGPSASIAPTAIDHTQAWMTTPSFPSNAPLPTEPAPALHDGLTLAPGSTSLAFLRFGGVVGANVPDRVSLDRMVYFNPITGNQTTVTGGDGIEGVTTAYARARRYPAGSLYDLHRLVPDGLVLGAICSQNNTTAGCTNGHVYGGMIRLPTRILPGSVVSVTYQTPRSVRGWVPVWLYDGNQESPGPGGNPYAGYGTPAALIHAGACYHEIDINDGFARDGDGVAMGRQLDYGTVVTGSYNDPAEHCFSVAPHQVFAADGANFTFHPRANPFFSETRGNPTSSGFHTLVLNWRGDGSHLLDYFLDGKLFATQYWEYVASTYVDAAGASQSVGMNLVIGNQAIPGFLPSRDLADIMPDDGQPGAWAATIQEIKIIRGSVANVAPAPGDGNAIGR